MSTLQFPDKLGLWPTCRISRKFFISSLFVLYILFPFKQWAQSTVPQEEVNSESYLVQFSDISLAELVRFVSEMTGKNFVYSEQDLEAKITVTADQPITSDNLFNLLLRVLHVNRLEVFQEAKHFLIFPSEKSKSANPIVSAEDQLENSTNLLLTKVFHIKNASLLKVRDLITKIVSPTALVEIFENARCLIVNDIYDNIQKVNELLMDIDKEDANIVFETYIVKTMPADTLKSLASLVLSPFTKDFDTKLVSNPEAQALHIVATKALIPTIIKVLQGIDLQHPDLKPTNKGLNQGDSAAQIGQNKSNNIAKSLQKLIASLQLKIASKKKAYDQMNKDHEEHKADLEILIVKINNIEKEQDIISIHVPSPEYSIIQDSALEDQNLQDPTITLVIEKEEDSENTQKEAIAPLMSESTKILNELRDEEASLSIKIEEIKQALYGLQEEIKMLEQEMNTLTKYLPEEEIEEIKSMMIPSTEVAKEQTKMELEEVLSLKEEIHRLQNQISSSNNENMNPKGKTVKNGEQQLYAYRIQYKSGDDLLKTLKDLSENLSTNKLPAKDLIRTLQSSQFVSASNQLLFLGDPYALERIQDILDVLDVPTRQVLVELLVIDASIEKALEFGIDVGALLRPTEKGQWAAFGGSISQNSGLAGALSEVGENVSPNWGNIGSGLSSGVIGRFITYQGKIFATLGSLVHALSADGNVHVLMNPKILSEENKAANFFVGETTRIKVNTQQSGNGAGLIVNGYEIRDIGSTIQVTPKINNDYTISLSIQQEISDSNQLATGSSDLSAILPLTKTSRTKTEVLVPNQGFVVLSGMTHEKTRKTKAALPLLGSIPFLSAIFSKSVHTTDRRNLLVFIRAQIINEAKDTRSVLESTRQLVTNNPLLPKSFEERFNLFSPPIS